MSFVAEFDALPLASLVQCSLAATPHEVQISMARTRHVLTDFAQLISPTASQSLESLCRRAQTLTQQRFGKVIRLFAPIYLSNECINSCKYCGFSRANPILRATLDLEEVLQEARALKAQGFRNLLLVAGEHPKFVSTDYLSQCVGVLHDEIPSISLEVGPMPTEDYRAMARAGADGLTVYQETYDRQVYAQLHTAGPKRDFNWRLETPERAFAAGFRRLGIGALYGLGDWRSEAICLAAHADYLLRHCWKAQLTISLPRLRPHAGQFQPPHFISDRDLVQLTCALRIAFPDAGLVLSTRERPQLRDGLIPLGITLMSAGSHTEPGGYTGAGRDKIHLTERGRIRQLADTDSEYSVSDSRATHATVQFEIADARSPQEIAGVLQRLGYDPVWKDWDAALTA